MAQSLEFEFFDDGGEGRLVPIGGPVGQLRQVLARGDLDAAVKLYEEAGGAAKAGLLEEAKEASFETKKAIAQVFRRAREFAAAASLFEALRIDAEAAPCFEQASDFARAAEAWRRQGELTRAAQAMERAGKVDEAAALYEQAGAKPQMAEALARAGRYEQAATVYRGLGNLHGEVESLRACVGATPGALLPSLRLAQLLSENGHPDKAIQLLMGCARADAVAREDAGLLEALARLFEQTGDAATAAKVRARLPANLPVTPQPPPMLKPVVPMSALGGDAYGFLKALPMFGDLSHDDMRSLFRICTQHAYEAGAHLIEPGEPGRGLSVIVEGQVEVFGGASREARLLNTLGVGSYIGEISLLLDGPTSARVTARTPVRVLFIGREAFRQYLFNTPTAALRIYRLFSTSLAERVRTLSAAR